MEEAHTMLKRVDPDFTKTVALLKEHYLKEEGDGD
jgi:hypothetical protein